MNIKPLGDRLLIEATSEEEKTTKSGIVLPDTVDKKKKMKGAVVAVGPGRITEDGKRIPMSVKVGDKVLFKEPWSEDNKFEEGDKKYFLVEENEVLGIIE